MRKRTEELESKIVRSPRRFEAGLQEVMDQKKFYIEKRETMLEQIRSKKPAIEKIESYLSIVRQHHANFPELTEAYKRLTLVFHLLSLAFRITQLYIPLYFLSKVHFSTLVRYSERSRT